MDDVRRKMEEILNTDDSDFTDLYVTQNSQKSRNFWRLFSRAGTEEAVSGESSLLELSRVASEDEHSSNL